MKENRAILLLKSLNKNELRWFQKFVESSYHNSNPKLVALYGLLRKEYPDFLPAKTSPEILFKKLFTRKSFDAPTIRLLTHRLANLLEDFLLNERLKKDKVIRDKLLVKDLGERNAYGLFEKKTRNLLDELKKVPVKDANYYRHRSDLHLQYYGHPATDRQRNDTSDLFATMENLDNYFALSKLKLTSAFKAREHTLSEHYEIKYLDQVLEHFDKQNILSKLYTQVIDLQNYPDAEKYFLILKQTFINGIEKISLEDKRLILQVLLNYCVRKSNQGIQDYSLQSFELFKVGLENNCILVNEELSSSTFINIVSAGVLNDKFDWLETFIQSYDRFLDVTVRKDTKAYSLGLLNFYKKDFENAIDILQNHSFKKPLLQLSAKSLVLRGFIELFLIEDSYYDFVITQLNNFEKFVRKNISASSKVLEAYLLFIKLTKRFIKSHFSNRPVDNLRLEVIESSNLVLKKWLIEKIEFSIS